MKKYGFTLAETLITLAIIGICAAMLITTIKNINPNEKSNIVMARKIVGNFTEATKQVLLFNSKTKKMDDIGCNDTACVTDLYAKYLQVTRKLSTNTIGLGGSCSPVGELIDGSMFCIEYDKDCGISETNPVQILPPDEGVTTDVIVSDGTCAMIYYDVNGSEKPNLAGKDQFVIPVRKTGVRVQATNN